MRYAHTCPACGMQPAGELLGQLSSLRWYRCRYCSRNFHTQAKAARRIRAQAAARPPAQLARG
ncbi:MAG: hypothetical protein ACK50G_00710 [bacterium]|jgi:formate dehydrogenase maturation protein FdhE